MTPKQALFVQEYLVDLNATQAAIRAGYSGKTAYAIGNENLTKPIITNAIQKAMEERMKIVKIDADYVLRQAVKVHERCLQEVPVFDKKGNETGEYKFDSAGANKSLEIIGKHVTILAFDNNSNINHNGAINLIHKEVNIKTRIAIDKLTGGADKS